MKNKNQELMNSQKVEIPKNSSFRQKPESSYFKMFWTPAFAGVTTQETFYEIIKFIRKEEIMADNSYSFASLMEITKRPSTVFVKGRGSWLKDANGKEYLDFVQGWGVNCLGHSPKVLVEAIAKQAGKLIKCRPAYYHENMIKLADLIVKYSCLHKVFFTNSGAEANEGA